jgi:hypothetical protein
MKLYHATKLALKDDIEETGIRPAYSNKLTAGQNVQDNLGVYGFANFEDAVSFATDNNYHYDGYIICTFDTGKDETIPDTEYEDGVSWLVVTDENILPDEIVVVDYN